MRKSASHFPWAVSSAAKTAVPGAAPATSLDTRPWRKARRSSPATSTTPLSGIYAIGMGKDWAAFAAAATGRGGRRDVLQGPRRAHPLHHLHPDRRRRA